MLISPARGGTARGAGHWRVCTTASGDQQDVVQVEQAKQDQQCQRKVDECHSMLPRGCPWQGFPSLVKYHLEVRVVV